MSAFLDHLTVHLRQAHRAEGADYWLLCPSLPIGEQWLAGLCQRDPSIQLPRLATIWHIVFELAKPAIERFGLKLLLPDELEGLIWELYQRNEKLFATTTSATAEVRGYRHTILELRLAGLESGDLDQGAFETKNKGRIVTELLTAYENELKQHHLADPARVMALARDRLLDHQLAPISFVLLVPDDSHLTGLPQSLLDQIPEENRRVISASGNRDTTHRAQVKILRALDPRFEVRAVIGTLLQAKAPFDTAEVLYPEGDLYPRLFLETLSLVDDRLPDGTLPCTFGSGVPVSWTKPARALRLWMAWSRNQFRSLELFELLTQQLLRLPEKLWAIDVLRYLRNMSDCTGLNGWLARLRSRGQSPSVTGEERDTWLFLKAYLDDLLALVPEKGELTASDAWRSGEVFFKNFFMVQTAWDQAAQLRALQLIGHLKTKVLGPAELVWERLQNWIEFDVLPAEASRPGCLHLAPLSTGGQTGRSRMFIIGMNEDAFPALSRRQSLLTDRERKHLSPELANQTRRNLLNQQEQQFDKLRERATGEVVFIYPCAEQFEGSEVFPNYKLLQIFRQQTNQPEGDLGAFEKSLAPPIGPESPLVHLTSEERWLSEKKGKLGKGENETSPFPHLLRGTEAIRQRQQLAFTPFDGWVPAAGLELSIHPADHPLSANALQTLTACPLQFYYSRVLQLETPMVRPVDPGEWLHPLIRGQILHQVFNEFHLHLRNEKRLPSMPVDEALIMDILETNLDNHAHLLPAVSDAIKKNAKAQLTETLQIFLQEEVALAQTHRPEYFEVSFGLKLDKKTGGQGNQEKEDESVLARYIDTEEPISLQLPSGRTIYMRGRIDRIDRVVGTHPSPLTPHSYFVWDYKTGRIDNYLSEDALSSGRILQPLLYQMMAEQRLREMVDPQAVVEGVGFFFPSPQGGGERITWTREELHRHMRMLDQIVDVIEQGTFLPTDDANVCDRCDYQLACDLKQVHGQTKFKLGYEGNVALDSLRVLRQGAGGKKNKIND